MLIFKNNIRILLLVYKFYLILILFIFLFIPFYQFCYLFISVYFFNYFSVVVTVFTTCFSIRSSRAIFTVIYSFCKIKFGYFLIIIKGSRGNKLEQAAPLTISLVLLIITIFGYVYYLIWQSYVYKNINFSLYLDLIVNGIGLLFLGAELLFSLSTIIKLSNSYN